MNYIIVTEQERHVFINRVNDRLASGWRPCGGPFITTFCPGFGHVHAFAPDVSSGIDNLTISIEYNQAMIFEGEE